MFPSDSETETKHHSNFTSKFQDDGSDSILSALDKLISDNEKEQIWPEMVRLLLVRRKTLEEFGEFSSIMQNVQEKLIDLEPSHFNTTFTYSEKLTLLTVLIDTIHDLNEFRSFLNTRNEQKSAFNKDKMDVY